MKKDNRIGYQRTIQQLLAVLTLLASTTLQKGVEYWKQKAIYQVITDRFYNSSTPPCPKWRNLTYCGGNWNGLIDKMEYISGMGFKGVWVSPVQENSPGSYHGYSIINIFKLNPHFGNPTIFKNLTTVGKKYNVSVMVDVVPNHMAAVMFNYSKLTPFNKSEYFHDYCYIHNNDKLAVPWRTTNCRLFNFPDLKHEHPFVLNTLTTWAKEFVANYSVEGLRLDAIPHMPHFFLKAFSDAVNTKRNGVANGSETYIVGECFDPRFYYVASFQNDMDAVFNFPLYFAAANVFKSGNATAHTIRDLWTQLFTYFKDVHALGTFLDNHDNERFLYKLKPEQFYRLGNALSFLFFVPGIPNVFYGTEQEFNVGNDPETRFPMWMWRGPDVPLNESTSYRGDEDTFNPYSTKSKYYLYIKTLNHFRDVLKIWEDERRMVQHLKVVPAKGVPANDGNIYSFQRSQAVLVVPTGSFDYHRNYMVTFTGITGFEKGEELCDIQESGYCVTIGEQVGEITLQIVKGEARVMVPKKYHLSIEAGQDESESS